MNQDSKCLKLQVYKVIGVGIVCIEIENVGIVGECAPYIQYILLYVTCKGIQSVSHN